MRIAAEKAALLLARESAAAAPDSCKASPAPLEQEVIHLFDQLRELLLRYTLNFGLGVEDGEEVIQEVFLALFRHLQQGKPRENLRGWVFRVAHNLALKRRAASASTETKVSGSGDKAELLADPAPDPEEQCSSSQMQQKLLAVFRVLPEQDRRCLILRAEGLRYREIAQVLGMSLGAVSMSLSRSLARLARATGY